MSRVSVIMPVYNGAKYISDAIDSILVQTYKDWELIIINDGSKDKTSKIAQKYANKFPDKIKYFYQDNKGPAIARNKGIGESHGEYIAILDSDDMALSERLEKQVSFLDKNPNIGLIGGHTYFINERGKIIKTEKVMTESDNIKKALLTDNQFIHSCVMFRKESIKKVGFYRQGSAEDYDLWLRISEHFEVANLDEFLCMYRIHSKSISIKARIMQDKLAELAKELAIERRLYGMDRLQKGEDVVDMPLNSSRESSAKAYVDIAFALYKDNNLFDSFYYILKAIIIRPLNLYQIKFLVNGFFLRGVKRIFKF